MSSTSMAVADPEARAVLRQADPVLARLIDARPDFHPRAWMDELPPLDAFGTLVFQVIGQQLSVGATRTILSRLEERFGGPFAVAGRAARGGSAGAPRERDVGSQGRDVAGARGAVHGRSPERRGTVSHEGRRDRDLALRRAVQRAYGFDHLPTEDEMVAVAERWRPYRSLAVSYLFASEFEEAT
jgi:DNA-3-methyladenine glycosylase II